MPARLTTLRRDVSMRRMRVLGMDATWRVYFSLGITRVLMLYIASLREMRADLRGFNKACQVAWRTCCWTVHLGLERGKWIPRYLVVRPSLGLAGAFWPFSGIRVPGSAGFVLRWSVWVVPGLSETSSDLMGWSLIPYGRRKIVYGYQVGPVWLRRRTWPRCCHQ